MEPLASRIRPHDLDEYVGQTHLVGPGKPLRLAIEQGHVFSFILWGPPGTGKTTLARIYANAINAEFHELSAVSAGKDDIRKILGPPQKPRTKKTDDQPLLELQTSDELPSSQKPRVLFLDEIHRFNKAQQDFLLPYVESGELVLIGATTENPSFEVISALLSRMRVFVLEELKDNEMATIVDRTGYKLDAEAKQWLIEMANGDARQAITMIENTAELYDTIGIDTLKETLQSKFLRYDKKGEEHYNVISAFIKSMRASRPNAAMYYLARMIESGEDPKFIARRMVIFASEDIGLAQPTALVVANEVFRAVETIGMPECALNLAHGVAYLANAPKDRSTTDAIGMAMEDAKKFGNLPVPMKIRNAPTSLMKDLGYGKDEGNDPEGDLMPEKLRGREYFDAPGPEGAERKRPKLINNMKRLIFVLSSLVIATTSVAAQDKDIVSTREMERINWMEFKEVVPSKISTVLLPTGTLEPHGVINNGADNTAPFAMAKTIARRTNSMVAPTLPYGITGSLEAYPGAFQITEAAYRPFVKQIVEGLVKNGFRSIIILNGHGGGQTAVLQSIASEVAIEKRVRVMVINWWSYASDETKEVFGEDGGHAGNNETAFIQAIDPTLVHRERYKGPEMTTAIPAAGTWTAVPFPSSIELYQKGQGYPIFDQAKADLYYKKVTDKVAALIVDTVKKWDLAGL